MTESAVHAFPFISVTRSLLPTSQAKAKSLFAKFAAAVATYT
jgi:hypothetical protein